MSGLTKKELGIAALVVGVLGVGLYYKVFVPRREREYSNNCAVNLKNISLAMMQYTMDNDDTLPRAWFGKNEGPSDATNYKWMDAIFPYVKAEKIFNCPKDSVNKPYRFRSGTNYGSYAINNTYFAAGDNYSPPAGRKITELYEGKNGGIKALVVDARSSFQIAWPDALRSPKYPPDYQKFSTADQRHGVGRTIGYLDVGGWCKVSNRLEYWARPKTINGQTIYTGFTVEND
jgi:hypothetical protein